MTTPSYVAIISPRDWTANRDFVNALEGRELTVHAISAGTLLPSAEYLASHDSVLLFADRTGTEDPFGWLPESTDLANVSLVVSPHALRAARWSIPGGLRGVITDDGASSHVLRSLILSKGPPLPSWLDCKVRIGLREPTGVAWWTKKDILVSDTYHECLFRMEADSEEKIDHVMVGLEEPHHVTLNRREVLVASTGENRIVTGVAHPKRGIGRQDYLEIALDEIEGVALARPHGVWAGEGHLAIADTDNQRVLLRSTRSASARWQVLKAPEHFVYPCGVTCFGTEVWVTNSYIGAIDLFDLSDRTPPQRFSPGPHLLRDPNAIVRWKDHIFLADEIRHRLVGGLFAPDEAGWAERLQDMADEWICSPWGLSVNSASQLAVADRLLGVIWKIDLQRWQVEAGLSE